MNEKWFKQIRDLFAERFGASVSVEDFEEHNAARRLALLGGQEPAASAARRRR